jgi:hypothetical protein
METAMSTASKPKFVYDPDAAELAVETKVEFAVERGDLAPVVDETTITLPGLTLPEDAPLDRQAAIEEKAEEVSGVEAEVVKADEPAPVTEPEVVKTDEPAGLTLEEIQAREAVIVANQHSKMLRELRSRDTGKKRTCASCMTRVPRALIENREVCDTCRLA